jgi:hypothetical protein
MQQTGMTGSWFTCNLGDAMLAEQSLEHIRKLFLSRCADPDSAREVAVFVRHESQGRLHCEVHVYFSPAAIEIANAFDAVPCLKPSATDLGLLAGSASACALLFPGKQRVTAPFSARRGR